MQGTQCTIFFPLASLFENKPTPPYTYLIRIRQGGHRQWQTNEHTTRQNRTEVKPERGTEDQVWRGGGSGPLRLRADRLAQA
jgi:hypothetical protein